MIKCIFLVAALVLSGCGDTVNIGDITKATTFCSTHSGIFEIRAIGPALKYVQCQDNVSKRLNCKE